MKRLLQLSFFLLSSTSLYCQQFIDEIKIKEYYPEKSMKSVSVLGNAGNSVLFKAGYFISLNAGSYSSFLLTGGNSNNDFLIKKDMSVSSDNFIYASPYLYFSAGGRIIYKTDLIAGTTSVLKESEGGLYCPVKAGNNIFYWESDYDFQPMDNGTKVLYKTDGSSAGTGLVKDLNGNRYSYMSKQMVAHNANVYFLENDSTGTRLWRSDGTAAGTVVAAEVYCNFNNSLKQNPVLMNGSIYFVVDYANKETYLWKYNIASNTKLAVKLINNQEQRLDAWKPITPENRYPVSRYGFTVWGNSLYFRGNITGQTGLWKSDGTNAGTLLIKNITGELDEFTVVNDKLYFVRTQVTHPLPPQLGGPGGRPKTLRQLWVSDGTPAGTNSVKDYPDYETCDPNPRNLVNCNNQLFFLVNDSLNRDQKNSVWIATSNGTSNGTKKLANKDGIGRLSYNKDIGALFYSANGGILSKGIICKDANIPVNNYTVTQSAMLDQSFNKPGTCDSLIALVSPYYSDRDSNTTATVWIEKKQPVNFVKRHYQVTPLTSGYDGEDIGGRVKLYFKQAEFDAFNALYTPALPSFLSPKSGRQNIRIAWYPGISNDKSGLPASYQGNATIIDPDDEDIIYNSAMGCWEVSFNCKGFGGFILQTQTAPLKP
ncbi:MAG: hypothetical protein QM791_07085 [Ferruginibacter sp.]